MYINHDDLVTLATGPSGQGEAILQGLDRSRFPLGGTSFNFPSHREIVGHKRIVQNNKQLLSSLRRKARDRDLAPYRFSSPSRNVKYDLYNLIPDTHAEFYPTRQAESMQGGQMMSCFSQCRSCKCFISCSFSPNQFLSNVY